MKQHPCIGCKNEFRSKNSKECIECEKKFLYLRKNFSPIYTNQVFDQFIEFPISPQ
jgi:rRNA maturation endonuclease Nob1